MPGRPGAPQGVENLTARPLGDVRRIFQLLPRPATLKQQIERPQTRLEQPRGTVEVALHGVSQLLSTQALADVVHRRLEEDVLQSDERARSDHRLGIVRVHLYACRELLGRDVDDAAVDLEPCRP